MSVWEIVLIGAALAMDAVAVSMAGGMAEPRMSMGKALAMTVTFALFQFAMPLIGYYCGYAFSSIVERIAPWLSFFLLALIGGKMIADCVKELREKRSPEQIRPMFRPMFFPHNPPRRSAFLGRLLAQGVATSLDALAVGVTLLAAQTSEGLPFSVFACAAVIGAVTFALSFAGVQIGRCAGDKFADTAGLFGGAVLIAIGIKLLAEGLM